jgi:hypothetical protein
MWHPPPLLGRRFFRAATSSHTETLSNRRYHRPSDRALPRVEKFAPRLWSLSRPLMDRTDHDVPFATSNAGLVVRVLRSLGGSRYRHSSTPPPGPGFRGARASARRAHDPSAFVVPPIQRAGAPMSVTASTARPDPRRRSRLWTRSDRPWLRRRSPCPRSALAHPLSRPLPM